MCEIELERVETVQHVCYQSCADSADSCIVVRREADREEESNGQMKRKVVENTTLLIFRTFERSASAHCRSSHFPAVKPQIVPMTWRHVVSDLK